VTEEDEGVTVEPVIDEDVAPGVAEEDPTDEQLPPTG